MVYASLYWLYILIARYIIRFVLYTDIGVYMRIGVLLLVYSVVLILVYYNILSTSVVCLIAYAGSLQRFYCLF